MFESQQPVFEDQPLVPTDHSTGKFDIDAFLNTAKREQRQWFIATSILAATALAYALYLCLQFPFHSNSASSSTSPIGACTPATGPAWAIGSVNLILAVLPLALFFDQLRSFIRPSGVISFKPYFARSTSTDEALSPREYLQKMRDRSLNWIQTTVLAIGFVSCVGLLLTMAWKSDALCTTSSWSLTMPYLIGTATSISLFTIILASMVYKHKKAMLALFSPSSALDSYHPL